MTLVKEAGLGIAQADNEGCTESYLLDLHRLIHLANFAANLFGTKFENMGQETQSGSFSLDVVSRDTRLHLFTDFESCDFVPPNVINKNSAFHPS